MHGLTYAERLKREAEANARRREMALSLIEIVTRAWRARRNQPPTFAEAEDWFLVRANTSLALLSLLSLSLSAAALVQRFSEL